ncbi:phosphotransferase family protein [Mycoplasmopsis cricetuli]|uniref:phosphotransferase family protein n=1 Tax=Mycoplasmopsis cricetuli TaxID=171283 RepID=UPI0004704B06|nr:phosphotransferase [Mycoplasmopsis cricetuli]
MKKIPLGYTNESYHFKDEFIQNKKKNKFNHKINYEILKKFNFVPELLENSNETIKFRWIDSIQYQFNDSLLKKMADNLRELHDSKLDFPKTNHAARVKEYRKILKNKNINIEVLNKYYKRINLILSHSQNNRPLHNDLFQTNILLDKNNKLWIVDWEYASMGDKHFDLAYFITSNNLSEKQEEIFLNQYENYWEEYLYQQKIFIYYLIILWVNAQEVKPFDDIPFYNLLENAVFNFEYKKKNNLFKK